jgi:hypothetical protein
MNADPDEESDLERLKADRGACRRPMGIEGHAPQ